MNDSSNSQPELAQERYGPPLIVHQPVIPLSRDDQPASVSGIPGSYLTQASLFYTPHVFSAQQLALAQQQMSQSSQVYGHMPSLMQVHTLNPAKDISSQLSMQGYTGIPENNHKLPSRHASTSSSMSGSSAEEISPSLVSPVAPVKKENIGDNIQISSQVVRPMSVTESPPATPKSPETPLTPSTPMSVGASPPSVELCAICNDKATGHHYGVTSCEGCKGFFKRSVQNKKTYTCRNLTQDCQIDKRHRNRCQYCRFQKCAKAGMLKEAVREDRTPGGKHKNGNQHSHAKAKQESRLSRASLSGSCTVDGGTKPVPPPTLPPFIEELVRVDAAGTYGQNECSSCLLEKESEKTLMHVSALAEWQLNRCYEWFQKLNLLHGIGENDLNILIRSAWCELMVINLSRRSLSLTDKVMLCKGHILDFKSAESSGIGDIVQRAVQLTAKFKNIKLDSVEFSCLKVVIMLNPDLTGLQEQKLIEKLQDSVHTALQKYVKSFYPKEHNRFGNILLRLPELRSIGTKCLERLFMLNLTGQITVSQTLAELLHSARK